MLQTVDKLVWEIEASKTQTHWLWRIWRAISRHWIQLTWMQLNSLMMKSWARLKLHYKRPRDKLVAMRLCSSQKLHKCSATKMTCRMCASNRHRNISEPWQSNFYTSKYSIQSGWASCNYSITSVLTKFQSSDLWQKKSLPLKRETLSKISTTKCLRKSLTLASDMTTSSGRPRLTS